MILVIVESPSKCQKIQSFLGNEYKIMASMGHVRALKADLDAVGLNNNFEPIYDIMETKRKTVNELINAAKKASKVILAADDDAEGEAIAYHICFLLKLPIATTERVVFHEITATAVRAGVASPRTIDMNRVNSQQARAMLDLLIGFTISPLLWGFGKGLSAGRCQTPALGLLCDRETAIDEFKSQSTFPISGKWQKPRTVTSITNADFPATLTVPTIDNYDTALKFVRGIAVAAARAGWSGTITSLTDSESISGAPKAFMTATMQQTASNLLGLSPAATMRCAQKLYEAGHITYMRTDSCELSAEAREAAIAWIRENHGDEYVGSPPQMKPPKIIKKTKNSTEQKDAAHEAIRPTHLDIDKVGEGIEARLYNLIWRRTIQSQMAASRSTIRKAVIDTETPQSIWHAQWERLDFPGWRILEAAAVGLIQSEAEDTRAPGAFAIANAAFEAISILKQGDRVKCNEISMKEKLSQPPARYTEASLVSDLKAHGIGRPSTYANILEAVTDKGYVKKETRAGIPTRLRTIALSLSSAPAVKESHETTTLGAQKDKLFVTPIGRKVSAYLLERFSSIFNYGYTASMNEELDIVAKGTGPWKDVLKRLWADLQPRINDAKAANREIAKAGDGQDTDKCRHLGEGVRAMITKYGECFAVPLTHSWLPSIVTGTKKSAKTDAFFKMASPVKFETATLSDAHDAVVYAQAQAALATATDGPLGNYNGHAIILKKGPHGWYLQAGAIRAPAANGDATTKEEAEELIKTKATTFSRILSDTVSIREGPKGYYIMKTIGKGKKPIFKPLPTGEDPKTITLAVCNTALESSQMKQKKVTKK